MAGGQELEDSFATPSSHPLRWIQTPDESLGGWGEEGCPQQGSLLTPPPASHRGGCRLGLGVGRQVAFTPHTPQPLLPNTLCLQPSSLLAHL